MTDTRRTFTGPSTSAFPQVWGRVPSRSKNFTGRADHLQDLYSALNDKVTAVVPHALQGYGGVGKTLMAVEYAHRFRGEYDVVWWIMADQPGLVRSSLAHLAPHLGLPGPNVTGIEDAASEVLAALRKGEPYGRWLLVFDNADEPEDLSDVIPDGDGHVLVTSRNHRWHGIAETVSVDVFERHESVEFFQKRLSRGITQEDASRLAEALGHLPLALEQAGALQSETGMSVDEYLRLLEEQTGTLLREGKPPEYPESMAAAWQLSVAKLKENLPEAMELLRSCAFFGPEPIPRDIFFPVETGYLRPEMAELLADPIRLGRAIGQLGRYALVRIDSNRTLQVHRLIQALLREDLTPDAHEEIRSEVWSLMSAATPQGMNAAADQARYLDLLPHVSPSGIIDSTRPECRDFLLKIIQFLEVTGDLDTARQHARQFIETWTEASGPDDPHVLRTQRTYANRLRERGRYNEAFELDDYLLWKMTEVLGRHDAGTLSLLSGIGADLRARGDFKAARELDEETRRTHEEVYGPTSANTVQATHNLGISHLLNSDFTGARQLHERAYMLSKRLGPTTASPTLLNYQTALATAVRLCGDYTEACDLGEDALAYGQEELKRDHPQTLRTQLTLAIARRMVGEVEEAFELVQDVHSRYLRRYSLDHPETLAAAMCLANILRMRGDLHEALELAEDTYTRYERVYGARHPFYHGCSSNVALLHRFRGDSARSRDLNEAALTGLEEQLTRDHHIPLGAAVNLASDLADVGETKNAVRLGRGTLRRFTTLLGEEHPLTLTCGANLALDLRAERETEEADALRDRVQPGFVRALGREHQFVQAAMNGERLVYDFDPLLI